MILDKGKRHFRRYREIARIVASHGWGWMLGRMGLPEHFGHHRVLERVEEGPVHLREMLEELGPTFVKLGQLLSTRPDLLPESYIVELEKLQDTAPTLPFAEITAVIESEFEVPLRDLFAQFEVEPIAAASIAQVHKAVLLDGTQVIVKVQRPHIREHVQTDIEIMYKRAQFLEAHWDKARTYGLMDLVDEFAITIREELDYTREARNTDRLREEMVKQEGVNVPLVYWNLTTGRVLTLELMQGVKVTEIVNKLIPGTDPKLVATRLASAFLKQVFVDGFFHADPHPGNILVSEGGEIALVDCGMVGRLDADNKAGAVRLLMAFEQQDTRALADEILHLGISREDVDIKRLTIDLGKVLRGYYDLPGRSVNMGQVLMRVFNVSSDHKIRLPANFTVLAKVFTNIDGICSLLDPDFNFTETARSYIGRAMRKELRPEKNITEIYRAMVSMRAFLLMLPENLDRLMRKAVEGNMRIEFKHQGLEGLSQGWDRALSKLSLSVIVAAIIVGSSLIVSAGKEIGPWYGVPILGIIGYIVATVFGVWLIVSIMKSGRQR